MAYKKREGAGDVKSPQRDLFGHATKGRQIADAFLEGKESFERGRLAALPTVARGYAAILKMVALRKIEEILVDKTEGHEHDPKTLIAIIDCLAKHSKSINGLSGTKRGTYKTKKGKNEEAESDDGGDETEDDDSEEPNFGKFDEM